MMKFNMKKIIFFSFILVGLLGVMFVKFGIAGESGTPGERTLLQRFGFSNTHVVRITFDRVVEEQQILDLLKKYHATPQATFMWTFGMGGSYRPYRAVTTEEFFQEMKAINVELFEKGEPGNKMELQLFSEEHPKDKILHDPAIQEELRSLLNAIVTDRQSLEKVKNNGPLIFSMEVSGGKEDLHRMKQDPMVKFSSSIEGSFGIIDKAKLWTPTPKIYENETPYVDPDLAAMTPQELYETMMAMIQ